MKSHPTFAVLRDGVVQLDLPLLNVLVVVSSRGAALPGVVVGIVDIHLVLPRRGRSSSSFWIIPIMILSTLFLVNSSGGRGCRGSIVSCCGDNTLLSL